MKLYVSRRICDICMFFTSHKKQPHIHITDYLVLTNTLFNEMLYFPIRTKKKILSLYSKFIDIHTSKHVYSFSLSIKHYLLKLYKLFFEYNCIFTYHSKSSYSFYYAVDSFNIADIKHNDGRC